jgi:hypothetical protein
MRYNSSTARDIDDALARPGVSELHDYRSPFSKYSWYQLALVHLGRTAGDLPLAWLAHLRLLKLTLKDVSVHDRNCSTITGRDQVGYGSTSTELGKATSAFMSALPPKTDMREASRHVR